MFLGLMDLLFPVKYQSCKHSQYDLCQTLQHFQRKKVLGYIRSKLFLFIVLLQTYE